MSDLIYLDWGSIDYEDALQRQTDLVETVHRDNLPGYLIFCTHPPVVTLGRATKASDVFGWSGKIIEISRGGRATYHGPSQLIVYPILNLTHGRKGRKDREIIGYLRVLEDTIVEVLLEYGVAAQGRSLQKNPNTSSEGDETGVWVGARKIASLGIAVRKWITFHGAAINLTFDPMAFTGMNPCGFKTETMVSLEQLLTDFNDDDSQGSHLKKTSLDPQTFKLKLKEKLLQAL